jgi:hypothetical protein
MRIMLRLGIVIVVALLGLNVYISLKPAPKPTIDQPLQNLLPPAPTGWNAKDEQIASTPEMQEQAEEILHFDDAVYRIYSNSQAQVGVYIAHWLPGKFSPAKVGSHSPDTCWVHNGWEMIERNHSVEQSVAGGTLKPMETGIFEKDQQKVHVIFWHLVGGTPMQYDLLGWQNGLAGRIERLPALWADFRRFGLDQRKEQLVIRLSSNVPFEQLWADRSFTQVMDELCRSFDLYAKLPPPVDASVRAADAGPNPVRAL